MSNKKLKKETPWFWPEVGGGGGKGGLDPPSRYRNVSTTFRCCRGLFYLTLHLTVNSIAGENKQHPLTKAFSFKILLQI